MAIGDPTRLLARMDAITPSTLGLTLPEDTPYEEWAALGGALGLMDRASRWWLGDWINFGERRYGETYSQALAATELDYQTLRSTAYVANRFGLLRRRNNLSWSHHRELASLLPDEADVWLDMAEEWGWSRKRLREELQQARNMPVAGDDLPTAMSGATMGGRTGLMVTEEPPHAPLSRLAEVPIAPSPSAMAVHYSSADDDWHTPWPILDCAAALLGGIDLDPCADAGRRVPAARHYTEAEDGLAQFWRARSVWLNPPYGRAIGDWVEKLRAEYDAGNVAEALALLPARTDTEWWQGLCPTAVCFLRGRLHFSNSDNPAPFPSALAYLGPRPEAFGEAFGGIGRIWVPWEGEE